MAAGETRWVNVLDIDEVPTEGDDFQVTIEYEVETSSNDPDISNNSAAYSQTVIRLGGDGDGDGGGSGGCFIGTADGSIALTP